MNMQPQKPNAYRVESVDFATQQTAVSYVGTLEENRQRRILDCKEWCGQYILKKYPEYKQSNAALGIYDEQKKQQIINGIQLYRNYCDTKEAELQAAQTLDDVWAVTIDFSVVTP